jgi:hypothetical protein
MADTQVLEACAERRGGSSPPSRTKRSYQRASSGGGSSPPIPGQFQLTVISGPGLNPTLSAPTLQETYEPDHHPTR